MSSKLGILFLHHNWTPVVGNNYQSLERHNPGVPIITISADTPFDKGYSLNGTPELKELHSLQPSRSADRLVCSWFLQRKERCQKWWIVEWDVFCMMPVEEYYRPVWDYPFVASAVYLPHREPNWYWFRAAKGLPQEYVPFRTGATPFLYLVSEHALEAVCQEMLRTPLSCGNGELRFATTASKCGFPPCGFSPPNDQITWAVREHLPRLRSIYHPVKTVLEWEESPG